MELDRPVSVRKWPSFGSRFGGDAFGCSGFCFLVDVALGVGFVELSWMDYILACFWNQVGWS
jgi:hypothetical protein